MNDLERLKRLKEFRELEVRGLIVRHPLPDGGAGLTFPQGEDHPDIIAFRKGVPKH